MPWNNNEVMRRSSERWRQVRWFVFLWIAGVLATGVIALVFKVLMLGAVKQ